MFSGLEDPLYTAEGIAILEDQVIVKSNKISGVKYALDTGCHTGTVTSNTISLAIAAVFDPPAGFTGVNPMYNTGLVSSGTCPLTAARQ
jgi:hypothetical protein